MRPRARTARPRRSTNGHLGEADTRTSFATHLSCSSEDPANSMLRTHSTHHDSSLQVIDYSWRGAQGARSDHPALHAHDGRERRPPRADCPDCHWLQISAAALRAQRCEEFGAGAQSACVCMLPEEFQASRCEELQTKAVVDGLREEAFGGGGREVLGSAGTRSNPPQNRSNPGQTRSLAKVEVAPGLADFNQRWSRPADVLWRTQARSYRAPSLVVETSAALVGIAHAPHWSTGPHSCRNRASCARRVGGRVRA